jgi:ammonium transporter, Amt family
MNRIGALAAASSLFLLDASPAFAQAGASPINSGDTAWMIVATALVMVMTPGLAFFYGGMVRGKNAVSLVFQSMVALPVITIVWFLCGYSLAFSPGSPFLGGLDWSLFSGVGAAPNTDYGATIPHVLFAIYQCMFAVITPALVIGAFAERVKFKHYLLFLVLWSLLVYSPVAHWVWAVGGYLRAGGTLDFAGGLVVHMTAGFSALAAAMVLGKRSDYGNADYSPSNVPLIAVGTGLLWFGWFGFNGGSAIGSNELAVNAFSATHLAASGAMFVWMLLDWKLKGKPSLTGACIGAVVGLVAVTPACGFVSPGAGLIVGCVGALVANIAAYYRGKSQLDDSLDVFACHGLGGLTGILLTGVFGTTAVNAAGADAGATLFMAQLKGAAVVAVYSFVVSFVLFKILQAAGIRANASEESAGMDSADHGEKAYA